MFLSYGHRIQDRINLWVAHFFLLKMLQRGSIVIKGYVISLLFGLFNANLTFHITMHIPAMRMPYITFLTQVIVIYVVVLPVSIAEAAKSSLSLGAWH